MRIVPSSVVELLLFMAITDILIISSFFLLNVLLAKFRERRLATFKQAWQSVQDADGGLYGMIDEGSAHLLWEIARRHERLRLKSLNDSQPNPQPQ